MSTKRERKPNRKPKSNKVSEPRDLQLEEFETKDLGEDIAASGSMTFIPRKYPTSVLLDREMIEKLRIAGEKRGIGYQTMMKIIVHENIKKYS